MRLNTNGSYKFLALILLVGLLLRSNGIVRYGLWGDEAATMQVARGLRFVENDTLVAFTNLDLHACNDVDGVIVSTIRDNGNSVLYNLVLHFWLQLFGLSDLAARCLSLVLGTLCIPLAYCCVWSMRKDRVTSLVTALLVACHPLLIGYSQEARSYSMALFLSLSSTFCLLQAMREEERWRAWVVLYAVIITSALLSHYLVAYVLIAQVLFASFWLREPSRRLFFCAGLVGVLVVLGSWYWIGGREGMEVLDRQNVAHLGQAAQHRPGDLPYALPVNAANVATGLVQSFLRVFSDGLQDLDLRIREVGWLLLIPIVLIALTLARTRKEDHRSSPTLRASVLFLVVQGAFAVCASMASGHCLAFLPQYALFVVPYAMILLGWSFAKLWRTSGWVKHLAVALGSVFAFINAVSIQLTYTNPMGKFPARNEYIDAARYIDAHYVVGDTVLIRRQVDARSLNVYLTDRVTIQQRIEPSLHTMYAIVGPDRPAFP